ncbi:MAG TPA: histone deacetylase [Desulfomonilaceae bacterium]|nr:histone deacetylase [Desulfomonilaceae bacterium]
MKPTGIVKEEVFLRHEMGPYHPESPHRLQVIYEMIEELPAALNIVNVKARDASEQELSWIHDNRYVRLIAATAGRADTWLDPDTSTCADSWSAASRAVGGLFNLLDAVMDGRVRNGFALVRPPGHHAERGRAMGFCLFNNIALAAKYALKHHGMERIAIVDWDLHHGNGTQNAFYDEQRVLFISTHQYPHYPGSGGLREVGSGAGEGYTVNLPMDAGCGDEEYLYAFHALVAPLLEAFRPQMILVSAGFDAHELDPLGGMGLTEEGYQQMLQILMHLAAEVCSDRLVLTLEGGYNLRALRDSVRQILICLSGYDPSKEPVPLQPELEDLNSNFRSRLRDALAVQRRYWPGLPSL